MKKYIVTHCHSSLSNGTTNIDSVTKFEQYIQRAKEEQMTAIAFTEHGNVFNWLKKKETCEEYGLKYIHAVELYVTESLTEKQRDNYHVCLYAKNYDGVLEINSLISKANNRTDGHFYFVPRISLEELTATSDNILITTACIGGLLCKGTNDVKFKFLDFLYKNQHRCWLEIQHHQDDAQVKHNAELLKLHKLHGFNLIVGTDTHALNSTHALGRKILQKSKKINFDDESGWDITWKTYDELVDLLTSQNIFTECEIHQALENTNVLADMVETFSMDRSYKYPKMSENPKQTLKQKIWQGIKDKHINLYSNYTTEYIPRIKEELEVYEHNGAFDFLLLDEGIKTAARNNGIYCGPSRGSVSGSLIAYLIGMTDMDSIKHKLNFNRFMSKERISLADVDTDWSPHDREWVENYIFNLSGLHCSKIITFNTVALKGSIRDVCRAIYTGEVPDDVMEEYNQSVQMYGQAQSDIAKRVMEYKEGKYLEISNYICENIESNENGMRAMYPKVFEYVDIINGTIVSVGCHPCGIVVSPIPLHDTIGTFSSATTDKPISMLNMKEIDSLNFVKLDVLGLDNIGIINQTCELAGIPLLNPDNVPDEEEVWKSMRADTTGIFQFESDLGKKQLEMSFSDDTIRNIMEINPEFKYIDIASMSNGAIRPAGASYREQLSQGKFHDNGHYALNEFLAPTLGFLVYQEQIIEFLNKFCGYSMGEADIVRRAFSKKTGTDVHIPKIKEGFIATMKELYNVEREEAEKLINDFIIVIKDASEYLFSLNHSQAYSYIGYMCGWLRYHYPLQFLTATLNINNGNIEKTTKMIEYAKKQNINILQPTYGKSKSQYFFDINTNTIYKGIESVKFLNQKTASELYEFSQNNPDATFIDIIKHSSANSKQLNVLITIGYFSQFGTVKKLLKIVDIYNEFASKKQFSKSKYKEELIKPFAGTETSKMFKDVDTNALVNYLCSQLTNEELPIGQLIEYQVKYTGDTSIIDSSKEHQECVVLDVNTKYTPMVTVYKVKTGEKIKVKVSKKYWNEKPLNCFDFIYVTNPIKKNKRRLVDGEWTVLNEFDIFVNYYRLYEDS